MWHPRDIWYVLKATVSGVVRADLNLLAAGLSFFALLALAPLLVFGLAIAGMILGEEVAREQVHAAITEDIGVSVANYLLDLVDRTLEIQSGLIAAGVSLIVLIMTSTRLFAELRAALDRLWGVPTEPAASFKGAILRALKARALALLTVIIVSGVMLVLIGSQVGLAVATRSLGLELPLVVKALELALAFLVLTGLFTLVMRVMPSRSLAWRPLVQGASFTAVLFLIGRYLVMLYISLGSLQTVYGAAGAVIVLLTWGYYSALVFLVGAKVTHVLATRPDRTSEDLQDWLDEDGADPPA